MVSAIDDRPLVCRQSLVVRPSNSLNHAEICVVQLAGLPSSSARCCANRHQIRTVRRGRPYVECATSCNSRGLMTHHRRSVTRRQTMTVWDRQDLIVSQVRSSSHASCSSNRFVFNSGLHSLSAAVSLTDHVSVALCNLVRSDTD